tara:strand:- start:152 stop:319 length:168 start_codon:yes stop_codon:yes gene_type:complete
MSALAVSVAFMPRRGIAGAAIDAEATRLAFIDAPLQDSLALTTPPVAVVVASIFL